MGSVFTQADWELVQSRAATTAAHLRAKGVQVADFAPLPPVPQSQLDQFARKTGYAFPRDFAEFVTEFAGGWTFDWVLHIKKGDIWLKPPVYVGNSGGNAEVPFIGAALGNTLLDRYKAFQAEIRNTYRRHPETERVLPALFPLHTWDGGGGDYTVLRLDITPAQIYYLDHETAWRVDDQHVIGTGFREFVLGWANLGFPNCEYHKSWVNPTTRQPDDTGAKAELWRNWLADPNAV